MRKKHFKIPATNYLFLWLKKLMELGYPVTDCMAQVDIPITALEAKKYNVTLEQQQRLVNALIRLDSEDKIIASFMHDMKVSDHGILGLLVLCGMTFRQVVKSFLLYYRLRSRLIDITYYETQEHGVFRVEPAFDLKGTERFTMEMALRTIAKTKQQLLGQDNRDNIMSFTFNRPLDNEFYEDSSECRFLFNQDHYQLAFPLQHMDYKLRSGNKQAYYALEQQCRDCQRHLERETYLPDKIAYLLANCDTSYPSLKEMADMLGISTRSLNRHLQKEGMSYQVLIDKDRIHRSKMLLKDTSLSLRDIAKRLNYSDTAHLCHAFKRHTQLTPSQYRVDSRTAASGLN